MTGEIQRTVKQEWQEYSAAVQNDVNATLADLQLEIEAANARLAAIFEENPEEASECIGDIIEYLDDRWGYIGDYFMITGKWYFPSKITLTDNGFAVDHDKSPAFNIAKSNGFIVYPVEDDEQLVPEIGLSFIVGSYPISTAKLQGGFELLAFARLHETSLQYMRPGNSEVIGASIKEVAHAISSADALLKVHLNDSRSNFYETSAAKQGHFLQSVIDYATSALPPADSLERVVIKDATPDIVYIREAASGKIYSIEPDADVGLVIEHGLILDFTTLDTLKDGIGKKRYTAPNQTISYKNGLCAVVSPTASNIDLCDYNNPDLIVPMRRLGNHPKIYIEPIEA